MKRILKEVLIFSIQILFVLIFSFLFVKFVGQRTEVIGSSMESTLSDGENLWVNKIGYRFNDPQRFDIVVFPYRYKEKTYYIKRIIGLPGETIRIDDDGNIYINDELLNESYGREVIADPGRAAKTIHLGDDEYFVMGDNRNNSSDSRKPDVGNLKRSEIIGRAVYRIYPFNKMGSLKDNE
ncbi:MAG: signal peptidase I [Lachnospiraceae bacterium]|nr:signal peptidase I [Lachnospiraceae bacterium]